MANDSKWTNKNPEEAAAALNSIRDLVNEYGMRLVLEALIENNRNAIAGAQLFGIDNKHLIDLEANLKVSLEAYANWAHEFGKKQ